MAPVMLAGRYRLDRRHQRRSVIEGLLTSRLVDRDGEEALLLDRTVVPVRPDGPEPVDHGPGLRVRHLAEDRVRTLQPRRGRRRDEELGAVRAPAAALARVRHGEHVRLREVELGVDLVVELVAGATGAGA